MKIELNKEELRIIIEGLEIMIIQGPPLYCEDKKVRNLRKKLEVINNG